MTPDPGRGPGDGRTPPDAVPPNSDQDSFAHSLKAIGWGFLGIRKRSGQAEDFAKIKPLHLVVIALLAVAVFVGGLIALVKLVAAP
ncbi:MAG: DUF2970 domain-containing protein [Burkholderiales bacterium]